MNFFFHSLSNINKDDDDDDDNDDSLYSQLNLIFDLINNQKFFFQIKKKVIPCEFIIQLKCNDFFFHFFLSFPFNSGDIIKKIKIEI